MLALWLAAGLVLAFLAAEGTALVRRWALHHDVIDVPNGRSSHDQPVPRGGGIVIVLVTVLAAVASPSRATAPSLAFTASGFLIALVSLYDDVRKLDARTRLLVHGFVAVGFLAVVGWWSGGDLPFAPGLELGWAGAVLAFCWLVGMTNAFNFMDGIDGLAGLQGAVAGVAWAALGWHTGAPTVAAAGLGAAAASLGFLRFNWAPASIFMGDVGSTFLGFTFAALPLLEFREAAEVSSLARIPLAGLLVVWPFVFDAMSTFLRRLAGAQNVFAAHRQHIYQRLVASGLGHAAVAGLYGVLAALCAAAAFAWVAGVDGSDVIAVAALLLVGGVLEGNVALRGSRARRAAAGIGSGSVYRP